MDLRDFLNILKERGELVEINEEVDWDLEMSAISAMTQRLRGPALLFNKIKGMNPGYRAVSEHYAGTLRKPFRRIAICMGIEPDDKNWFEGTQEIAKKMTNVIKPVQVATGPCKEVIKMGKDVNAFEFPITYGGLGDCGRYLNCQTTICKDPDSDWTNWGNYATLVSKRNRMVTSASTSSDFYALLHTKYAPRGESMPVAIVVGGDPLNGLLGGTPLPSGVSEADVAGGMRGAPVELVKCETSDILVPANSEIVFEGEVRAGETALEGPKTECFGFTVGPRTPAPVIRIHCVTHRKDPIVPILSQVTYGMSSIESIQMSMFAAGLNFVMAQSKIPIKQMMAATVKWGGYSNLMATRNWYPGFIRDMFDAGLMFPATNAYYDVSDMVDDDVNIYHVEEIVDAIYTQSNPAKDWVPSSACWDARTSGGLVSVRSYLEREDLAKLYGKMTVTTGYWTRDNTTKGEPPLGVRRMSFETVLPDEIQQWVVDNWKKWGLEEEPAWNKPYLDLPPLGM